MRRSWLVLFALSAVYVGYTFVSRRGFDAGFVRPASRTANPLPSEYSDPTGVHIVHFYAGAPALTEGESTVLCYGVVNAASVRLEPPLEALVPSFNRCIHIAPEETTRYTLYASGRDGQTISAVFELPVNVDPAQLPRIKRVWTQWVKGDRFDRKAHCLCFEAENTAVIDVEPRAFEPYHGVTGCFYVVPEATTTYTIIGRDKKGRETRKSVTIEVPSSRRGGTSRQPAGLLAGNHARVG